MVKSSYCVEVVLVVLESPVLSSATSLQDLVAAPSVLNNNTFVPKRREVVKEKWIVWAVIAWETLKLRTRKLLSTVN